MCTITHKIRIPVGQFPLDGYNNNYNKKEKRYNVKLCKPDSYRLPHSLFVCVMNFFFFFFTNKEKEIEIKKNFFNLNRPGLVPLVELFF